MVSSPLSGTVSVCPKTFPSPQSSRIPNVKNHLPLHPSSLTLPPCPKIFLSLHLVCLALPFSPGPSPPLLPFPCPPDSPKTCLCPSPSLHHCLTPPKPWRVSPSPRATRRVLLLWGPSPTPLPNANYCPEATGVSISAGPSAGLGATAVRVTLDLYLRASTPGSSI